MLQTYKRKTIFDAHITVHIIFRNYNMKVVKKTVYFHASFVTLNKRILTLDGNQSPSVLLFSRALAFFRKKVKTMQCISI